MEDSAKTVEIAQVQSMPSRHTNVRVVRTSRRLWWVTCPLLCEIMYPWSRQRGTLTRSQTQQLCCDTMCKPFKQLRRNDSRQ